MKVCIAYPNKEIKYSETFIAGHIKNIKPDFLISSGYNPHFDLTTGSVFGFPMRIELIRMMVKKIFPRIYSIIYNKKVSNYLRKNKIDILLAEYGQTGGNLLAACKLSGTKLVVHFHGSDAFDYTTLKKYKIKYLQMFDYAKAIVVVSEDMKTQLIGLGASPEKIFKVPYGINTERFLCANPENADPIFSAVGRFVPKKAPLTTIRAFSRVLAQVPEAHLIMVGEGALLSASKKLALELKIQDKITFKGVLKPDQVIECLSNSRCFVQHSVRSADGDSEGMPNTILEAASCGLPIISTFHAGIKEAVHHGVSGYLTNEGDEVQMASYMIEIAQNPQLAKSMGKKAREIIIANYNLEKQIKELKEILTS
jgi:glycosyltransferase involved in cell wall biosynthesis